MVFLSAGGAGLNENIHEAERLASERGINAAGPNLIVHHAAGVYGVFEQAENIVHRALDVLGLLLGEGHTRCAGGLERSRGNVVELEPLTSEGLAIVYDELIDTDGAYYGLRLCGNALGGVSEPVGSTAALAADDGENRLGITADIVAKGIENYIIVKFLTKY